MHRGHFYRIISLQLSTGVTNGLNAILHFFGKISVTIDTKQESQFRTKFFLRYVFQFLIFTLFKLSFNINSKLL